jgi:hypothetical protein
MRTIGPAAWARSFPVAARDLAARRTCCRRDRLGAALRMTDGRTYVAFRETVKDPACWATGAPPAVLHPRFHLAVLPPGRRRLHALFRVVCIVTTPFFVGLPGFRSKLWMVDPATGDFAGLYEWDDEATARAYAEGLSKVLRLLSARGSVTYELVPGATVDGYLSRTAAGADGYVGGPAGGEAGAAREADEAGDPAGMGREVAGDRLPVR